jgi:DNA primase
MSRFAGEKVTEVRERTSIVEIVSRYTALKRTGRNHQGLCPLHTEKTPSFSVSEERGVFYCFGCQAGGDVFKFLMLKENLTFPEALERLAREAGIELPKHPVEERRQQGRERLLRVNTFAAKFFERALWENDAGTAARRYLDKREIRAETARGFGLGFAPGEGLAHALENAGAPLDDAESLGLIGRSTRGGWYDRFRSRLMFPITDLGGKIIAFGGRLLEAVEGQPKYLNSPESALFQKRRSVFGFAAAREATREATRVLLVEGYIDVIALAQAGVKNVVAPLGTAITADQIRLLKRFTDNFVLLFDGDRAGVAAAARSFSVFAEVGVFADAAFLPEAHDPDTFVRAEGREGIERVLSRSSPLGDHYLRSLAAPEAALAVRHRAAEAVAELLASVESETFRGLFVRRAAEYLGLPEEQLSRRKTRGLQRPQGAGDNPPARERASALTVHESLIIELLLTHPELKPTLPSDFERLFTHEEARSLVRRIRESEESSPPADFLEELPSPARNRVAKAWLGESEMYADPPQMLADCLTRLERQAVDGELRVLSREIREAEQRGDDARLHALLAEKQRLASAARQER